MGEQQQLNPLDKLHLNISQEQARVQRAQSYQIKGILGLTCSVAIGKFASKFKLNKRLTTPIAVLLFPSSCYLLGYNSVVRGKSNKKLEKYFEIQKVMTAEKENEISKQERRELMELIKSIEISK